MVENMIKLVKQKEEEMKAFVKKTHEQIAGLTLENQRLKENAEREREKPLNPISGPTPIRPVSGISDVSTDVPFSPGEPSVNPGRIMSLGSLSEYAPRSTSPFATLKS